MQQMILHFSNIYLCKLICSLFVQRGCEIDVKNDRGQTPLHVAILRGHSKIVERLVGYGAGVNTQDEDGNSPLYMILSIDAMEPPSDDTPELKKVQAPLCTSSFTCSIQTLFVSCQLRIPTP